MSIMNFVSKKAISRRTMLRGVGAALSLPLLDAMVPALSALPKPVNRLGVIYLPNGMTMPDWTPKEEEAWTRRAAYPQADIDRAATGTKRSATRGARLGH